MNKGRDKCGGWTAQTYNASLILLGGKNIKIFDYGTINIISQLVS